MSVERKCRKCDVVMVVGENWYKSQPRSHHCVACSREVARAWHADNKDKSAANSAAWTASNRERRAAGMMVYGASQRAAKKGLPFDLDDRTDEIEGILLHGGCHYTGLPFSVEGSLTWDSPSLDRVVPELGYVWENTRVVLHCINSFKGTIPLEKMCFIAARLLDWQAAKAAQTSVLLPELPKETDSENPT